MRAADPRLCWLIFLLVVAVLSSQLQAGRVGGPKLIDTLIIWHRPGDTIKYQAHKTWGQLAEQLFPFILTPGG